MTRVEREDGIAPGERRKASDINNQVNFFKDALGYAPDTVTYPGSIDAENFARDAGIREDKIDFDTATGHDHPYDNTARGARIADASVSDIQIDWAAAIPPVFVRGHSFGMRLRFGYFDALTDLTTDGFPGSTPQVTTGRSPVKSPKFITIPFSSGHDFDHDNWPTSYVTTQEGGAPFPNVGSIPVVVVTAVLSRNGIFAGAFPPASSDMGGDTINGGDVHYAIVPGSVTAEDFTLVYSMPYNTGNSTALVEEFYGFNWVAVYHPTMGGL